MTPETQRALMYAGLGAAALFAANMVFTGRRRRPHIAQLPIDGGPLADESKDTPATTGAPAPRPPPSMESILAKKKKALKHGRPGQSPAVTNALFVIDEAGQKKTVKKDMAGWGTSMGIGK